MEEGNPNTVAPYIGIDGNNQHSTETITGSGGGGATTLGGLTNVAAAVDTAGPAEDQYRIVWNDATGLFELVPPVDLTSQSLDQHTDVAGTAASPNGYVLTKVAGTWTGAMAPAGGPVALNDLTDVNSPSPGAPEDGYALQWDNGASEYNLAPPGSPLTTTSIFQVVASNLTLPSWKILALVSGGPFQVELPTIASGVPGNVIEVIAQVSSVIVKHPGASSFVPAFTNTVTIPVGGRGLFINDGFAITAIISGGTAGSVRKFVIDNNFGSTGVGGAIPYKTVNVTVDATKEYMVKGLIQVPQVGVANVPNWYVYFTRSGQPTQTVGVSAAFHVIGTDPTQIDQEKFFEEKVVFPVSGVWTANVTTTSTAAVGSVTRTLIMEELEPWV